MVQVGDVIEVATRKIGQAARTGTVTAVRGALMTVTWDSGEETSLIPAAGSVTVVGSAKKPKAKGASGAKKSKAGAKGGKRR